MFSNNTTGNDTQNSGVNGSSRNITPIVVLSIIIIVGLIGNSMVIAVVKCIRSMRTTTNYLLVNVAAADILTLLLTLLHVLLNRVAIGEAAAGFMCKVIVPNTLSNVALLATGLTLTVLAVERYNALVKPMRISRRLTSENVVYVIFGIWVISMVMALPMLVYLHIDAKTGQCTPGENLNNLTISHSFVIITMTIIPFLFIAFSYFQIISGLYFNNTICNSSTPGLAREDLAAKKRLVKLLLTVTAIFFVAFVPAGVLQIVRLHLFDKLSDQQLKNLNELTNVIIYLIPLHSSINPFLYAFQSRNYRDGFMAVTKKVFFNNRRDNSVQTAATIM